MRSIFFFCPYEYLFIYFVKCVVAVERLHGSVKRGRLKFTFAAWCRFTKDSRRIKEVLKVHICFFMGKKGENCERYINVGTFFSFAEALC